CQFDNSVRHAPRRRPQRIGAYRMAKSRKATLHSAPPATRIGAYQPPANGAETRRIAPAVTAAYDAMTDRSATISRPVWPRLARVMTASVIVPIAPAVSACSAELSGIPATDANPSTTKATASQP